MENSDAMKTHAIPPFPSPPVDQWRSGDLGGALERYYLRKWLFRTYVHVVPSIADLRAFCSIEEVAKEHEVCPDALLAYKHEAEEPKPDPI